MKKDKEKQKEAFADGVIEIILTLICFGVGALIVWLFGGALDSDKLDFELIVLIGIVVPLVVIGIISRIVQWIKKKCRKDKDDDK